MPTVPLAEMFGYVNDLRSMTQGRASYTMQFAHYERVPATGAAEIGKAAAAGDRTVGRREARHIL